MESQEFHGLREDEVISLIEGGDSLAKIASRVGKERSALSKWLREDETRSARAREARQLAAAAWDELAEKGIEEAADQFELARAKEMAHHYRWRASKIAPKEYGDKQQVEHSGSISIADALRLAKEKREKD